MADPLKIILYPDPRLKKANDTVISFDETLRKLVVDMFRLMREHHGVGLAAPQVGVNLRLFVANASGEAGDDFVYVNPSLSEPDEEDEAEEGCLSLPDIHVKVYRNQRVRIKAQDLDGKPFEQIGAGFPARVWQHEFDHLNGILLTDRMGPVSKMANRKKLKELEERFNRKR